MARSRKFYAAALYNTDAFHWDDPTQRASLYAFASKEARDAWVRGDFGHDTCSREALGRSQALNLIKNQGLTGWEPAFYLESMPVYVDGVSEWEVC